MTKFVDSRTSREGKAIRRRRECLDCTRRFTTYEYIENTPLTVVKGDGRREPFDRQKLFAGIYTACKKRPVAVQAIHEMVDQLESKLQRIADQEVSSDTIGKIAMEELSKVDEVAYVRFASVYRQFQEVTEFVSEIKVMQKTDEPKHPAMAHPAH